MRFSPAILAVALAACAHDVHAHYPAPPGAPPSDSGSITLVFTRPASGVVVAIDGVLLVDGANTSRVYIDHLPAGYVDLAIAMGEGEKTSQVWVESGRDTVIPVPSPAASPTDSIRNMVLTIATLAIYAWIRG